MAYTKQAVLTTTFTATATISDSHRFIGMTGALCGAAAQSIGVLEYLVDSGQTGVVMTLGIALVEASAAISQGAKVEAAANGKAVTKSSGITLGVALQAASADGDIIPVLLTL